MNTVKVLILAGALVAMPTPAKCQDKAPLKLLQSIPLPDLKDGDFDHFAVDLDLAQIAVDYEKLLEIAPKKH